MKKISMFIVMLLTCILSFGYPHHHFHHHHVHRHHRPTTTYHRIPEHKPHHRYVKDPVTNQVMLYFILTKGTNTYRHEGRDYIRCESCGKVFILKGKRFCKECIKTRRHEVQRIGKK